MYKDRLQLNAYHRKWRRDNPEKAFKIHRYSKIKKKYGLSELDYDTMFEDQEGKCLICKKTSNRYLAVDHDHQTGKVRGLLCSSCNTAIGLLKDDPLIIKSALEYVS